MVNLNKETFKYFSTELQKLSIHNNLLTTIDEDIFGNLIKLNELKIFNNRINCNCDIVNLVFKYTLLQHLLNTSANAYVECHQLGMNLLEFKKDTNCQYNGKYIYIYIYIYICVCVHLYMRVLMYVCVYMCIYMYMYIYIYFKEIIY